MLKFLKFVRHPSCDLTFSGQSTHICALKGTVVVAKVHIFVQSGI
jgi:hypothetical protein